MKPSKASRRCSTSTATSACCSPPSWCRSRRSRPQVYVKGGGMAHDRLGRHVVGEAAQSTSSRSGRNRRRRARSSRAATSSTSCTTSPTRPPQLAQVPEAESALVALDPNNGAIMSLVGGFDYFAGQASSIAPRWRSASPAPASSRSCIPPRWPAIHARLRSFSTRRSSSTIRTSRRCWRPKNSGGGFAGPMRLREALVQSRNLVSIRLLREMGVRPVDRLRAELRLREAAAAQQPDAGARQHAGDAARGRHRLRGVRERRLSRSSRSTSTASRVPAGRSSTRPNRAPYARNASSRSRPSRMPSARRRPRSARRTFRPRRSPPARAARSPPSRRSRRR